MSAMLLSLVTAPQASRNSINSKLFFPTAVLKFLNIWWLLWYTRMVDGTRAWSMSPFNFSSEAYKIKLNWAALLDGARWVFCFPKLAHLQWVRNSHQKLVMQYYFFRTCLLLLKQLNRQFLFWICLMLCKCLQRMLQWKFDEICNIFGVELLT